jgi:hypothetical protein
VWKWIITTRFVGYLTCIRRTGERTMTTEPQRSRAVFSTEDFGLMKEAVADYVRKIADDPRSAKFSNLYHRLGRLG